MKKAITALFFIVGFFVMVGNSADAAYPIKERSIILPDTLLDDDPVNERQRILNLATDDITLQGLVDEVELYYSVPVQEVEDGNYIRLFVHYSDLLQKGSSMTIYIDDIPIKSVPLKVDSNQIDVKVPLTGDALTQGFHNLKISFYGQISDKKCANVDSPANWLTIESESHISLNMKEVGKRDNALQDYPYPFVQPEQDNPVQSTIVIPDEVSASNLVAALKVASYLSSQVENKEIPILKESEIKSISTHIIAVGAEEQWSGIIKDMLKSVKVSIPDDELLVSNYFLQFPKSVKQLLLVTANKDKTIEEKVAVMTEERLVSQLANNQTSFGKVPQAPKEKIKEKHSFEDLNIPNVTLTGRKSMSQNYFYQLPAYVGSLHDAKLLLKLKRSEVLEKRDQPQPVELVITINDVPYSIAIEDLEMNEENVYEVDIPIKADTLKQAPYMTLQFKAHGLHDDDICVPPNNDNWIYISEESYLQLPVGDNEGEETSFQAWPSPFVGTNGLHGTTILLPEHYESTMFSQLQQLTNSFERQTGLDGLELMFENEVKPQHLAEQNVLVLGGPEHHPSLKEHSDQLLIGVDKKNQLDVSAFQFLNDTSKLAVWLQSSVWNNKKFMAVFSSVDQDEKIDFLSNTIIDYLNTNALQANMIVESNNGEIFTNELGEESSIDGKASAKEEGTVSNILIIAGIISIFVFSLIIFIHFYRKFKRNKE